MYRYSAFVMNVVDGDTVDVRVDLGFKVHTVQRLRLGRINAWEVRGDERPAGLLARDWLRVQILGKAVMIETKKGVKGRETRGKYGRWICEIETLDGGNVNDQLVALGHAKYQSY